MGSIRERRGQLVFDFRYRNTRCREQTRLTSTPTNRRKAKKRLKQIEAEITLNQFDYARFFPDSSNAIRFAQQIAAPPIPTFKAFSEQWYQELELQWRPSYKANLRLILEKRLYPAFGNRGIHTISKSELLSFRSKLAKAPGKKNGHLANDSINKVMQLLKAILDEASERLEFTSPTRGIKSLKKEKTEVEPLSLEEVKLFLRFIRQDYRNYFIIRFFTGMRTSEVHGLRWHNIDFKRRQILVREAWVMNELQTTKTDGSNRTIDMAGPVFDALTEQKQATGEKSQFVFCNRAGKPLCNHNVSTRVWHQTLEQLGLSKRRLYQTRHTAATLWLAAGENPEWIARQMGHSTTEMLFRVYSRFVPNLTRKDGSAFEALLSRTFENNNI